MLIALFQQAPPNHLNIPKDIPITCPNVLIQIPVYNEGELVIPLLHSLLNLDWPKQYLTIQILDDSTHEPGPSVLEVYREIESLGINLSIVTRSQRTGFKAGALKNGLTLASSKYVAVFDVDYIVPSNFLIETVCLLERNPNCACVQARCGFRNPHSNILTLIQSLVLTCHFVVFNEARWRMGWPVNFSGSCGLWRTSAIKSLGNWNAATLVEDLDLSIRAHLNGWRIIYHSSLVVSGLLPTSLRSWKTQQFRWTKGITQCSKKYLPKVISSHHLNPFQKLSLSQQLLQPSSFLIFAILITSSLSASLYTKLAAPIESSFLVPVACVSVIGTCVNFAALTVGQQDKFSKKTVFGITFALLTVPGLIIVNTRAVVQGVLGIYSPFVRTYKRPSPLKNHISIIAWPELLFSVSIFFAIGITANPFSQVCISIAFSLLLISLIEIFGVELINILRSHSWFNRNLSILKSNSNLDASDLSSESIYVRGLFLYSAKPKHLDLD